MKKITLIIILAVLAFNYSFAQIARAGCKKTCEIEKVVPEGVLLGIKMGNVCSGNVMVMGILPNTAAAKFGLNVNDLILYVDTTQIYDSKQMADLIASHKPSDIVTITYKRAGKEFFEHIVLGAKTTKVVKTTICCDEDNNLFNDINLSVFPNPSNGIFNIETGSNKDYSVSVYNSIGELLFTKENVTQIDLSSYSVGIYNVKVNGTSKLVVKQ